MELEGPATIFALAQLEPNVEPGGRANTKLVTENIDKQTDIVYQRIAPGHMGKYHFHRHAANIWIVLDGVLDAIVGGYRYTVRKGEVIYMPRDVPHATGNQGNTDMYAIEIYVPRTDQSDPVDAYPADMPAELISVASNN